MVGKWFPDVVLTECKLGVLIVCTGRSSMILITAITSVDLLLILSSLEAVFRSCKIVLELILVT
jgi:hypothetical protein